MSVFNKGEALPKHVINDCRRIVKKRFMSFNMNDWVYKTYKFPQEFIIEFKDYLDWKTMSFTQVLSEDLIREFADKVDWGHISGNQKLSEDFIREFKDKINWNYIVERQNVSDEFILDFNDYR